VRITVIIKLPNELSIHSHSGADYQVLSKGFEILSEHGRTFILTRKLDSVLTPSSLNRTQYNQEKGSDI
jgi:hypothetical protein